MQTFSSHRALIREVLARFQGQATGRAGGEVLAEFASVVDAPVRVYRVVGAVLLVLAPCFRLPPRSSNI